MVMSIFQSTRKKSQCSPLSKTPAFSEVPSSKAEPSLGPTERMSLQNLSTKNSCKKNKTGSLSCSNNLGIFSDELTCRNLLLILNQQFFFYICD